MGQEALDVVSSTHLLHTVLSLYFDVFFAYPFVTSVYGEIKAADCSTFGAMTVVPKHLAVPGRL